MSLPCSSQVYQVTPTLASCATSSRLNPTVLRRAVRGNLTSVGDSLALRVRKKFASSLYSAYSVTEAEGLGPDGIKMDTEGAIWVQGADIRAVTHRANSPEGVVLRIRESGEVLQRIEHDKKDIFSVTLGGSNGKTLFMLATEFRGSDKVKEVAAARIGEVVISQAPAPGAGWP
jgi:sugar lactone lactonase YvrE